MSDREKRRYSSDSETDYDYIQWKIAKIKSRLDMTTRRREKRDASRSPSTSSQLQLGADPWSDVSDYDDVRYKQLLSTEDNNVDAGTSELTYNSAEEETSTLDDSILALLGDKQPELLGPKIHPDLASRWSTVLSKGLSEGCLSTLVNKYPPAENCTLLRAPRINPEIDSVMNNQVSRRDAKLVNLQNQIGSALSALGQLTSALISEGKEAKHTYVELASDASRLLLDFHHKYSIVRRDLVALNFPKELKENLTNEFPDGLLFGKNFDKGMIAKVLEKKKPPKQHPVNYQHHPKQHPVNYQHQPQRGQNRISRSGRLNRGLNHSQTLPRDLNPSQSFKRGGTRGKTRPHHGFRPYQRRGQ